MSSPSDRCPLCLRAPATSSCCIPVLLLLASEWMSSPFYGPHRFGNHLWSVYFSSRDSSRWSCVQRASIFILYYTTIIVLALQLLQLSLSLHFVFGRGGDFGSATAILLWARGNFIRNCYGLGPVLGALLGSQ
jgi:hypothetical protein